MASLVAYDDSDSEAESEPMGNFDAAGQMKDTCDVVKPRGQNFASGILDVMEGAALPTKQGSCEAPAGQHLPLVPTKQGPCEAPAGQHLPLARLWRRDPGSCPSQRLQWPRTEPEVTFPTGEPPRPSLWTSHAPAGHVPLAAARCKQVKLSWGTFDLSEPSFCAQTKSETPGENGSSLQKKRREDCVVPYTPKRLRQLQALSTETGKSPDAEAQGPSAGRTPGPLCMAPRVSEFIQPYLDTPYKETQIARKVLFYLRGHRGPVNSIQWCPVSSRSHMFLSASMDKTFKVMGSGLCLQLVRLFIYYLFVNRESRKDLRRLTVKDEYREAVKTKHREKPPQRRRSTVVKETKTFEKLFSFPVGRGYLCGASVVCGNGPVGL